MTHRQQMEFEMPKVAQDIEGVQTLDTGSPLDTYQPHSHLHVPCPESSQSKTIIITMTDFYSIL